MSGNRGSKRAVCHTRKAMVDVPLICYGEHSELDPDLSNSRDRQQRVFCDNLGRATTRDLLLMSGLAKSGLACLRQCVMACLSVCTLKFQQTGLLLNFLGSIKSPRSRHGSTKVPTKLVHLKR